MDKEWQVWEGDLYLYTVHTQDEANEAYEAGFQVKQMDYS